MTLRARLRRGDADQPGEALDLAGLAIASDTTDAVVPAHGGYLLTSLARARRGCALLDCAIALYPNCADAYVWGA